MRDEKPTGSMTPLASAGCNADSLANGLVGGGGATGAGVGAGVGVADGAVGVTGGVAAVTGAAEPGGVAEPVGAGESSPPPPQATSQVLADTAPAA